MSLAHVVNHQAAMCHCQMLLNGSHKHHQAMTANGISWLAAAGPTCRTNVNSTTTDISICPRQSEVHAPSVMSASKAIRGACTLGDVSFQGNQRMLESLHDRCKQAAACQFSVAHFYLSSCTSSAGGQCLDSSLLLDFQVPAWPKSAKGQHQHKLEADVHSLSRRRRGESCFAGSRIVPNHIVSGESPCKLVQHNDWEATA